MGKIKKTRRHQNKKCVPESTSQEEDVDSTTNVKENVVQTIIDQLQTASFEEKYCGLQSFALFIENQENIEEVGNNGLVKIVAPLLLDKASAIRNAVAGSLRNMSTLGVNACETMMEQDVMTPLTQYFHEFAESWRPSIDNKKSKDEDNETLVNCINLLWNLCEASELAVKYVGQSRILDILPRFLDLQAFCTDLVIAVLQCVLAVVEDNPLAMEKVKSNSDNQLQKLLCIEGTDPELLLIKCLTAGVTINICEGNVGALPLMVINKIMSILANNLSVDHRLLCHQLSSKVPLCDNIGKFEPLKGKDAQTLESELKSVSLHLDAQQCSIEIIANMCSYGDSADSSDAEESSENDDTVEEELSNGNIDSVNVSSSEDKLSPEILEAFISLDIYNKVWAKTILPAENVILILNEYEDSKTICKRVCNLQSRALLCINNMLSSLPIENVGGLNNVYKAWVDTGKLVFKQTRDNLTLLESATAVMRAALEKMKYENNKIGNENLFNDLALSDIEMMLTGIRDCEIPEIRSNLIRMIGTLALFLITKINDAASNVVCVITGFILDQAHRETEVWVLAEAIDTLVDLYSEDETDAIAAKVNLVEKLTALLPILKSKMRQQRKMASEQRVLVSTASSNLPRFIRYKRDRITKL